VQVYAPRGKICRVPRRSTARCVQRGQRGAVCGMVYRRCARACRKKCMALCSRQVRVKTQTVPKTRMNDRGYVYAQTRGANCPAPRPARAGKRCSKSATQVRACVRRSDRVEWQACPVSLGPLASDARPVCLPAQTREGRWGSAARAGGRRSPRLVGRKGRCQYASMKRACVLAFFPTTTILNTVHYKPYRPERGGRVGAPSGSACVPQRSSTARGANRGGVYETRKAVPVMRMCGG